MIGNFLFSKLVGIEEINKSDLDSIPFYLLKHLQLLSSKDFSCDGFITLHPFTLVSFKIRKVTLEYAQFFAIDIFALH